MNLIPLTNLTRSATSNVRKTGRNHNIDQLVASIRTHGLLENLLVIEADNGFEVIGGGRRLTALQQLQQQGELPADYAAPCEIVPADDAVEISLTENVVREAMHPADQFEAWSQLASGGMSTADIAARFGVSEKQVRQRMKLGRLSPKLMQAYRDDKLALETLMAYTLSEDHARQEAVFASLSDSWDANSPSAVRRRLTETAVASSDPRAELVGVEAYQQAGGTIRRDLFEETLYFEDVPLLNRLAEQQLEQQAEALRDRWLWVEARLDFSFDQLLAFERLHPHELAPVPDSLNDRYDELVEQIESLMEPDDSDFGEVNRLKQELQKIEAECAAHYGFSNEERGRSGCIVTLDYSGLCIHEGLIRPEDAVTAEPVGDTIESEVPTPTSPYNQALRERLAHYRLHCLRMELTNDFEAPFDALTYALAAQIFGDASCHWLSLHAKAHRYPRMLQQEATIQSMLDAEAAHDESLPLDWLNSPEDSERFAAFCRLSENDKQRLFAACVARLLRPQLAIETHPSAVWEELASRLELDVAAHWRPAADDFLNRLTKSQLLKLAAELIDDDWAANYQRSPKIELVAALERAFQLSEEWRFDDEQRQRLASWLPEGMATFQTTEQDA